MQPSLFSEKLLPLFLQRYPGFTSFRDGGSQFSQDEDYKRKILKQWQDLKGIEEVTKLAKEGRGTDALDFLKEATGIGGKLETGEENNLLSWRDIDKLKKDDEKLSQLFLLLGRFPNRPDVDPHQLIEELYECEPSKERMTWALFYYLLWLYRPKEFFPVKIEAMQKTAAVVGFEVNASGFNREKLHQVYNFVCYIRDQLSPYRPRDLVDAQSFIWCCYSQLKNSRTGADTAQLWEEDMTGNQTVTKPELNKILYGPPGTGKTYRTIREAVSLIDGTVEEESANRRFQELKRSGRIEFITFHQSYSYEDFVEGIRPSINDEGEARFMCQDGIFKRIAIKAAYHCLEEIAPAQGSSSGPTFAQLWDKLLERIDEDESFRLRLKSQKYVAKLTSRGNIEAYKGSDLTNAVLQCGRTAAQEAFTKLRSLDVVNSGDVHRALNRGAHWHVIAAVLNELKKLEKTWKVVDGSAAPKEVSEEEMKIIVQAFFKNREQSGYRLKTASDWPPFVLIIDEINRGNISKILGELITLIEPDKRLGAANELSVRLPYSQEVFAVPGNLFVIGTMNTADKSIALVDVALRRRFQFIELNPDFHVCPNLPADLRTVVDGINQRIMLRKDRDHRIGHAYFMNVKCEETFDATMKTQILPLLAEYFYNDWRGLREVLKETSTPGLIHPIGGEGVDENRWQWYTDAGLDVSPTGVLVARFKNETGATDDEL